MGIPISKYVLTVGFLLLLPIFCPNRLTAFLWGISLTLGPFIYLAGFTQLSDERAFTPKLLKRGRSRSFIPPTTVQLPFPDSPEISELILEMIDHIIDDFVLYWFVKIDSDTSGAAFPAAVKSVLIDVVVRFSELLKSRGVIQSILCQLIPLLTSHINVFFMARDTVLCSTSADSSSRIKEAYDLRIAIEYNKIHRLHEGLSLKPSKLQADIERYSEVISQKLLAVLIDKGNMGSPLVSTLLRDIVAHNILGPAIFKLHSADTWNLMLISISKKILQERGQVDSVRRMLRRELREYDQRLSGEISDGQGLPTEGLDMDDFDYDLSIDCSGKEFESYIRNLSVVNSMSDLRAIQFALVMKLVRFEKSGDTKQKELSSYRKRVKLSMDLIEAKLNYYGGVNERGRPKLHSLYSDVLNNRELFLRFEEIVGNIPFAAVVHNSSCVSYFHEFLKTKGDEASLTYLSYLKFVDVVKDPLEDANMENLTVTNSQSTFSSLTELAGLYLHGQELDYMKTLDTGLVTNILLFIRNKDLPIMDSEGIPLARKSMLLLQSQAEAVLEQRYYEDFKKSSSFFRMLSSADFIDTDIYAKYFTSSRESNRETNVSDNGYTSDINGIGSNLHAQKARNQTFDPIRVFSSTRINQELDNIVGSTKNSSTKGNTNRRTRYDVIRTAPDRNHAALANINSLHNSLKRVSSDSDLFGDENSKKSFDVSPRLKGKSWLLRDRKDATSIKLDKDLSHLFARWGTKNPNTPETVSRPDGRPNLEEKIEELDYDIEQIGTELDLLKYLILKADLTNNQSRLRLLTRSRKILRKDLRTKELQRQRYIVQRNANSLYNCTTISVKSYLVETETSNFKDITYYIIHVTHSREGTSSSWEVPRRYTEFYTLHSYLKKTFKELMSGIIQRELFPKKVSISLKYHLPGSYLYERRKYKFEIYLKELLKIEEICRDEHFRQFLTTSESFSIDQEGQTCATSPAKGPQLQPPLPLPSRSLVSTHLELETNKDVDDMAQSEIRPIDSSPILHLSSDDTLITQSSDYSGSESRKKQSLSSINDSGDEEAGSSSVIVRDIRMNGTGSTPRGVTNQTLNNKPAFGEIQGAANVVSPINQEDVSLVEPMCDLFIAIFSTTKKRDINKGTDGYHSNSRPNYWLRGGAIVMVLQQLFGNTIDKYMRESILKMQSREKIHEILTDLKVALWGPGGYFERRKKLKESGGSPPVRTTLEMRSSSAEAKVLTEMMFIELCGKVVGLRHSREAATKVHEILQNPYLNTSLLLEILDLVIHTIFSDDHGSTGPD